MLNTLHHVTAIRSKRLFVDMLLMDTHPQINTWSTESNPLGAQ
jgi:hypothetical protein